MTDHKGNKFSDSFCLGILVCPRNKLISCTKSITFMFKTREEYLLRMSQKPFKDGNYSNSVLIFRGLNRFNINYTASSISAAVKETSSI